MSLSYEDSGVVDGLCETFPVDHGLQSPVHEFVDGESQNVIQLVLSFIQQPVFEPTLYTLYILFMSADPSKILLGSLSSSLRSSLAALRRWARIIDTLHISLLFFRPYFPMICISESRRSFS